MRRRWNLCIYTGFLLTVAGCLSYFLFFNRFPALRDFPWLNLPAQIVGLGIVGLGFWRAYARPAGYRGKVAAPVSSLLSLGVLGLFCYYVFFLSYKVPSASAAPQVGQTAPDFTLLDHNGQKVRLASLTSPGGSSAEGHYVLLVFYRGYW